MVVPKHLTDNVSWMHMINLVECTLQVRVIPEFQEVFLISTYTDAPSNESSLIPLWTVISLEVRREVPDGLHGKTSSWCFHSSL